MASLHRPICGWGIIQLVALIQPVDGAPACLYNLGQSIQAMMGTMLDAVTVTASRLLPNIAQTAISATAANLAAKIGFSSDNVNYRPVFNPRLEYPEAFLPDRGPYSYNKSISNSSLSDYPSPSISFDAEISMSPVHVEPMGGKLGVAVRRGTAPWGNAITQVILAIAGPELVVGKLGMTIMGLGRVSNVSRFGQIRGGILKSRELSKSSHNLKFLKWKKNRSPRPPPVE